MVQVWEYVVPEGAIFSGEERPCMYAQEDLGSIPRCHAELIYI